MTTTAEDDLAFAIDLAETASVITLAAWQSTFTTRRKDDGSVLTDADLAAENAILQKLTSFYPNDRVISEESGHSGPRNSRRVWIIDPLDQTSNFSRGLPEFATLVSLYDGHDPVCAVIAAPALEKRWWASRGGGAYADDGPITVSSVRELSSALISIAAPHRFSGAPNTDPSLRAIPRTQELLALADGCLATTGSGGFLAHMRVATGLIDISVDPWGELWDLAASALIVAEAGGTFTALDGSENLGAHSCVATNTVLHSEVIDRLRPV
jgi:histidinol-phosphatase